MPVSALRLAGLGLAVGALGALGRAAIKLRCEPLFSPEELEDLPPAIRRFETMQRKCRYRQRRPFRAARFRSRWRADEEMIIHPSTKRAGKCQATRFDDRGPSGDTEYPTCAEAVRDTSPREWRLVETRR